MPKIPGLLILSLRIYFLQSVKTHDWNSGQSEALNSCRKSQIQQKLLCIENCVNVLSQITKNDQILRQVPIQTVDIQYKMSNSASHLVVRQVNML